MDDTEICSVFPEFKELDDILRCGICYETITIPVIISCSHTFCSVCIRKWLSTKQECPSCLDTVYESSLRKNPIVANIVEALEKMKKIKQGKNQHSPSSSSTQEKTFKSPSYKDSGFKPKLNDPSSCVEDKTLTSPSSNGVKPKLPVLKTPPQTQHGDSYDFKPKSSSSVKNTKGKASVTLGQTPTVQNSPASTKVPCPICHVEMPERLVFDHLDRCSGVSTRPSESKNPLVSNSSSPGNSSSVKKNVEKSSTSVDNNNQPLEPIKKMVYNLLTDKQLRTELKKHGLATQGDRRTISSRLQRYVILHNAECDSNNPRPLNVIKQQLDKEEKAMSSASATATTSFSQMFKKSNNPEEIADVNKEYIRQNNSSYQSLIQQIKTRGRGKKKQTTETIPESDEDDLSAMNSRNEKGDSDSDCIAENLVKTPRNPRNVVKRKMQCIESESEDENESGRPDKKVKEATSPVLTRTAHKTPVRRELRSRISQKNKDSSEQDEPEPKPPQPRTRNQRKCKSEQPPKQTRKKTIIVVSDSEDVPDNVPVVIDVRNKRAEERLLSPTPDLFGSPSSPASSEVTCGQKPREEDSGDDALQELVSIMEDETGSSTDFDE